MFKSNLGYSLMEILVVLAIVGLMGLGTTTLVTNMLKLNQKTLVTNNLITVKDLIESNIKNDVAWGYTWCGGMDPSNPPAQPAPPCAPAPAPNQFSCLYDGDDIPCEPGALNPIMNPTLYNRNGDVIYDPSLPGAGFSLEGALCNTFGAPDDDCPFRYDLQITLTCPATQTECLKPDIRVEATASVSTATVTSLANRIETNAYSIDFFRKQAVKYEPLEVTFEISGNGNLGGTCTNNTPVVRPLTDIKYDTGNNITNPGALPGNSFTLKSGQYDCEVMAVGWEAYAGFSIQLQAGGTNYNVGAAYGGSQTLSTVQGTVSIDLALDSAIRILHTCGGPTPPANRGSDNFGNADMGFAVASPAYTSPTVLTRVTCIRKR